MSHAVSTKSKSPKKASKGSRRGIWKWIALVLAILVALPMIAVAVYYSRIHVPEPNEVTTAQVSTIYAADGQTELARLVPPEGNREQVKLDDVPEHLQNAVLAAEDREFWTNRGFSFTGFLRAAIGQVTGNSGAGGGSTITQQYVKNVLVGNEHSLERKAKELVYSVKMTNEWDKETILQAYLNTVYFGRNAYGVEAASNAYFDKPVTEITPEEAAVLAATIQLPSQLDPWQDREAAESRWNYVLDGMVEMGELPAGERAAMAYPETRDPAEYSAYTEATGTNGLIKDQIIRELETIGITEEDVTTRGLQITSTIDMDTQNATLTSVKENLATLQDDARAAAVSVDPRTGAVRGYYGGEEASGWDYANAALQTGSTFKIFGLAAALQQGIPLNAQYSSAPVSLPGGITVGNVSGSCGYCSIENALLQSYNTSFIRLQDDLENTTQDTADMAHALGVARELPGVGETLRENGGQPYEGIILGQYTSRPLDMAVAMATIANRGVWHQPHFVETVRTADGEVLYEFDPGEGERRVSAQVADNVLQAMGPIAAWSRGNALAGGRPSAAKTGTAQLGDTGANKDAWMIGGTPQLATAVWVGTADNTSAIYNAWGGNLYGADTPATIWKQVLDASLEGEEIMNFNPAVPVNYGGFEGPSNYNGGGGAPPGWFSSDDASAPSEDPEAAESPESEDPDAPSSGEREPGTPGSEPSPAPEPAQPGLPELPDLEPAPAPSPDQALDDLRDAFGV